MLRQATESEKCKWKQSPRGPRRVDGTRHAYKTENMHGSAVSDVTAKKMFKTAPGADGCSLRSSLSFAIVSPREQVLVENDDFKMQGARKPNPTDAEAGNRE
ncbi:hypothetical protein DIPPA_02848 [Diplonema papillatum]|nr:hypothetical protein DIPPA_02848 [Diplonema papillatum]